MGAISSLNSDFIEFFVFFLKKHCLFSAQSLFPLSCFSPHWFPMFEFMMESFLSCLVILDSLSFRSGALKSQLVASCIG